MTRVELLERAIAYALGAVHTVMPEMLSRPTPCRDWDLWALLWHLNESAAALHEGACAGRIAVEVAAPLPATDPARSFRERAGRLLGAWPATGSLITIGDCPLATDLVACAGALEIAVHGWDVSQATGQRRPIPPALAVELLRICPLLVSHADRESLFAARVPISPSARPSERLVAFLGRRP